MLKFSVQLGSRGSIPDYSTLKDVFLECEQLGYDAVYLPDGLQWTDFECWTALSNIAAFTKTLRLGPAATFFTYRHPALIAKMASTLDTLSDGRLELRLGAGGSGVLIDEKYCGIALPKPDARVKMLEEGVQIIKELWLKEQATFRGKYFNVTDATCHPRPLQKPRPPITICADGREMIKVAAKHADIWEASLSLEAYERKAQVFERYCKKYGRDQDSIERSFEIIVAIAENDREAKKMLDEHKRERAAARGYGFDPLEHAIAGSPNRCAEDIIKYRRAGISSFTIFFLGLKTLESLRLFANQVIPIIKNTKSQDQTGG
ncbi:hypothetical protein A3K70_00650 [Candidatus Bathyarchaeota archaeon RBG_16_48_13]|nr:MAG: hypothetical protein A3K70_00650 [Candidatus Bathyarchaeota archaeon RBG_16_48_13]